MKKIVITLGDPAGCGPLIVGPALDIFHPKGLEYILIGEKNSADNYFLSYKNKNWLRRVSFLPVDTGKVKIKKGIPSKITGQIALASLYKAVEIIKNNKLPALVTAPVSKEAIQKNIKSFKGHTEFLAESFAVKNYAMMMVSNKFKVVLLTRHIWLKDVSKAINYKLVKNSLSLTYKSLKELFSIKRPKIALASVNPHAGVNTFYGKEERVMRRAVEENFSNCVYGPYPADTLFIKNNLCNYDAVVASYHDQAMIPFKLLAFKDGVNLTLGLPIIRTSPAHGTAFDRVLKNKKISFESMLSAIKLAYRLAYEI